MGFAAAGALGILLLATRRATRRTHIPLGPFLIVAALAVAAYGVQPTTRTVILPPSVPAATGTAAVAQLDRLPVLAYRPHPGGYERGCAEGQACSFGPAWSDDVDVPGGHDGCDTRNDILSAQLSDAAFKQGSRCVVVAGVLEDPYTGQRLQFLKAHAAQMPVDHLIPLALAWDLGASSWPAQQRQDFANDPRELQLTGKASNDAKADSGPGEWMPPNRGYHCTYAARFVEVAAAYRLPVTAADAAVLRTALAGCP